MIDAAVIAPERIRPLRRSEYDRLVSSGLFDDQRLELLEGVLIEMSPQGTRHAEILRRIFRVLFVGVGTRATVQCQLPIALSDESEPEPDISIIPSGDYSSAHPDRVHLVVEVADSSIRKDRELKARLYAAAQVPEFWLVDLQPRTIEVRRSPRGGSYDETRIVDRGELSPLEFPDVILSVAELLA